MADHSKPVASDAYANWPGFLDGRFDDLALGLDPAVCTPTNLPVGAVRWTSAGKKWEKWSGTAWGDLTPSYAININGTVGATAPSTGAFTELSFTTAITLTDLDLNNATTRGGLHALDSTSTYSNLAPGFASPGRAYVDVLGSGAYGAQMMHQMSDALPEQKIAYRRWRGASWGVWTLLVQQGDDLTVASLLSTGYMGYGTGAGGTVTQATSKSSAVTLNKVCGKVTMHAAAMAAGTGVSFLFNNSSLAATDTLTLSLLDTSIASPLNYQVWASVRAGAAVICLLNRSTGSLSEAVAINFTITKGVTS